MKLDRRLTTSAAVAALVIVAQLAVGGFAGVAVMVLFLPALGWAFDNRTGTFFVLGLLMTIVFVVLVTLISLMALAH